MSARPNVSPGLASAAMPEEPTLLDAFAKAGFARQDGRVLLTDMISLCEQGMAYLANGNNADNPYLAIALPKAPNQTADDTALDGDGYSRGFRVGANEAIVVLGQTPPEVQYFSFAAFVASKKWEGNPLPAGQVEQPLPGTHLRTVCLDGRRTVLFCVGDTLNNLTLMTPAALANPSVSAFEQRFMIIFTADSATDAAIRSAAASVGFPEQSINTKVLPVDIARLGIDEDADTFAIGQRMSLDGDAAHDARAKEYLQRPTLRAFRLTPLGRAPLQPLPLPPLRVRGTGRTELSLWPAVQALRQSILAAYPDHEARELVTSIWINESYELMQQGIDAIGESRDTTYLATESFVLPDDPDAFVIVYGVDHAATGKAAYANVVAYGAAKDNGVVASSSRDHAGSATRYLPDCKDATKLYAIKVTRHADNEHQCLVVSAPTSEHPLHGITPDSSMYLGFRAYLERETKVGPAWQELVFDRAILFTRMRA